MMPYRVDVDNSYWEKAKLSLVHEGGNSSMQICQMLAMACEQPKERPISHWTGREIANEVR
ncbi:MAG TPA: hypothetical protein VF844_07180 [Ktedonobacteraceae bacterium]